MKKRSNIIQKKNGLYEVSSGRKIISPMDFKKSEQGEFLPPTR